MEIGFFKGPPTEYIIRYASGRITREGTGLAFFYLWNWDGVLYPTAAYWDLYCRRKE